VIFTGWYPMKTCLRSDALRDLFVVPSRQNLAQHSMEVLGLCRGANALGKPSDRAIRWKAMSYLFVVLPMSWHL
jgi:hypothetical protein